MTMKEAPKLPSVWLTKFTVKKITEKMDVECFVFRSPLGEHNIEYVPATETARLRELLQECEKALERIIEDDRMENMQGIQEDGACGKIARDALSKLRAEREVG